MKSLAIVTALFLAQPGVDAPKQSLMPNVHKTDGNGNCGEKPATPAGCITSSAKCVGSQWQWTC